MKTRTFRIASVVILFGVILLGGTRAARAAPQTALRTPVILQAAQADAIFRIPAPPRSPTRAPTASINISYIPAGSLNSYGYTCQTWPAGSQTAFAYAASLWATQLVSSVPIVVEACWVNLGFGVLGATGSGLARFTDTWYSLAAANAIAGTDLDPTSPEIYAMFSSTGIPWYYGTDGNTPISQYDFVTVALHELAHGLGFGGSMDIASGIGNWGYWRTPAYPDIYDRSAINGSSIALLNTAFYPNNSAALAAQLTSNNVYFNGAHARAANGGNNVKLYTPATWSGGSSYSHVDEIYNGTANALMTYSLGNGESIHSAGPITLGMLRDVGWNLNTPPPTTPSTNLLPLVAKDYGQATQGFTAPTLLNPSDGAAQAKPLFDWTDVTGATSYRFQLSTSNTFNTFTYDQSVVASQFTFISTLSGTYYWRVYASDGSQNSPFSATRSVVLANYTADDDGDGLPNGWELHGYDANNDGTIDVDLPALGANYRRKDIFVEMDYMYRADATNGLAPNQNVLNSIVAVFNSAPVSNPDGTTGITIHLELDDLVPYDYTLDPYTTEFNALKSVYFDANRTAVYHYMIWANRYSTSTSSGVSMGIPATDFLVTLGGWNSNAGGTDYQKIGTFIHELGHNLGLTHGGNDHTNYKPNYLSVMNYRFQTIGVYRNGVWYNFDYQRFDLPSLNESALNETLGLNGGGVATGYGTIHSCANATVRYDYNVNAPIDWNCDGDTNDTNTSADINWDIYNQPAHSYTTLGSQNNWANIIFHGGGVIGSGLSPQELARRVLANFRVLPFIELTFEEDQQLHK